MPAKRVKTFKKELGHRQHRSHRSRKGSRPLSRRQAELNRLYKKRHEEILEAEDKNEVLYFKLYEQPTTGNFNNEN